MPSNVRQGLQSCLEPSRRVEPRVLIQNLAPRKSTPLVSQSIPWAPQPQQHDRTEIHSQDENNNNNKKNIILNSRGCGVFLDSKHQNRNDRDAVWSSIQALTDSSQNPKAGEASYVHPLVRRTSASKLSKESLEMCTESLGSETGSSIGESHVDFPSPPTERSNFEGNHHQTRKLHKKTDRSVSFPPPLTSISFQTRPHREGGRLVLKAMRNVPSCGSYFQTERANGRLRLSLLKENDSTNVRNDGEAGEEKLEHDDAEGLIHPEDDVENVGYEIGVGELPRPSRCSQGGTSDKGIPSWSSFWVPIS